MATSAAFIPIVGYEQIVSIVNDEDLAVPVEQDQTHGRKGKMKIAFRFLQADTQNANDGVISLVVKRPLDVVLDDLGEAEDQAPYTPILSIVQSGQDNPTDTHPRIVTTEAEAENIADGTLPVTLYFTASAAPGVAAYDVLIDFSHSATN